MPQRPTWLPPAGVATALHLRLPSGVDLDDEPVFTLTTASPTRTNAFFDPDGNGWAGLQIKRGDGGSPHGDRHAVFAFGGPTEARIAGPSSARLHVAIDRVVPREITVHAVLSVCTAGSSCTSIADASRSVDVGLVSVPLDLDLGAIDAVVPAGGTLRLEVSMPSGEDDDMVFFADTTTTPSRLTVTFP